MSGPVIFRDLPATFPEPDKYKKSSIVGAVIFHGLLILAVVVIPLLVPQALPKREMFIAMIAPLPPPPAPLRAPEVKPVSAPLKTESVVRPVPTTEVLVAPVAVPKVIVPIVDLPSAPSSIGVAGGLPGGVTGGVLGGVLGGTTGVAPPSLAAPPPPPPPPLPAPIVPAGPIRVGGNVKEPKPVKMVPPIYPQLASRAHVHGIVVLEATLTIEGAVSDIRVISGHPLLTDAAIHCLKQWRYEPTLLNGAPVAVILTAKVRFEQAAATD